MDETYENGAFVLVPGTDPAHSEHGYAVQLLRWQIEQHRQEFPAAPVSLETAKDHAQRVYERLGFEEMAREQVNLPGVDERVCKLPEDVGTAKETVTAAAP